MKYLVALALLIGAPSCAVQPIVPVARESLVAASIPNITTEQRGAAYARANCAGCHAISGTDKSPLASAPHFRDLALRYPVDDLAEAFAEGIDTAHAAMPEFIMSAEENSDLIAYLKSIQTHSSR